MGQWNYSMFSSGLPFNLWYTGHTLHVWTTCTRVHQVYISQCCQLLIAGTVLCKMDCSAQTMCLIEKIRALLLFQLLILHTGCGFHAHLIESKQRNEELIIERHLSHFQKRFLMKIFYETLQIGKIELLRLRHWFYWKNKATFTFQTFNSTH